MIWQDNGKGGRFAWGQNLMSHPKPLAICAAYWPCPPPAQQRRLLTSLASIMAPHDSWDEGRAL